MALPPGIQFLLLPTLLLGGAYILAVLRIGYILPLAALPPLLAAKVCTTRLYHYYRAYRLGARLLPLPSARGRLLGAVCGNLDILRDLRRGFNVEYPLEVMRTLLEREETHTVNTWIGFGDYIVTTEPEYMKIVLATDFANYEKGSWLRGCMSSVLGTGVFASDGDMWRFHRQMTRPFFNRERISDFDIFAHHADRAIALIQAAQHPIDFQDLASRFTMDSATSFLFGVCADTLQGALPLPHNVNQPLFGVEGRQGETRPRSDIFTEAFGRAIERISSRIRWGGVWPLLEMTGDATEEPMRIVDAFIGPIVEAAVKRKEAYAAALLDGEKKEEAETLLDELLNLTSDPKVLKDEVLNILLAGRDTTMSVLTSVVYFLSVYPEVFKRLRTEILERVGTERRPTYDDIREMKYLRAVINETMRLYPPVPSNIRQCLHETTWPSADPSQPPFYIPAGAIVNYAVFLTHRRKDLYGPTADLFDPERFLDDRLRKHIVANPFCFLPFNAGPRVCLGQQELLLIGINIRQFAYNEVSFMIIRLLQIFSGMELAEEAIPPEARVPAEWKHGHGRMRVERFKPKLHLTMSSAGGLWVRMTEHEASA
ncbi:hypothetical protein MKEN_00595300 [Mycena kentingensis (nom. inval.)]|nr:hypothetical protein MKEN_00595300 [Mycena kentingensis (nom. inval.)]